MGGSCPECRSPVDLGQEFCLECGAPIRIRRQQRIDRSGAPRPASTAVPLPTDSRRGFPWIPFLAILGLVTLGVVFILAEHDSKPAKSASKASPVDDLTESTATSSNPSNFPTTLSTATTPGTNCTPGAQSTGTPGIATTADGFLTTATTPTTGGATTPTTSTQASADCAPGSTTATTPGATIPSVTGATTSATGVTGSTATTAGTSTSGTTAVGSGGTWPEGKSGFTVVLASFAKDRYSKADAEARSVEAQQKGVSSGVLDSDKYSSLTPGLWVVFSGIYDTAAQADKHIGEVAAKGYQGAYRREVKAS
jgi:hypothetical protein